MEKLDKNNLVPLHQQLKELLKHKIETNEYKLGESIPSTSELCSNFGLSHITVRKAVSALVNEGFLVGVPGKGTFVSETQEKGAQNNKKNKIIGVLFPEIARPPFFSEIFHGIESSITMFGYHAIMTKSNDNVVKENESLLELKEKGVQGIILIPVGKDYTPASLKVLHGLSEMNFPVVLVDRKIPGLSLDYVTSQNESGGYMATKHLIKLGHRRIAIVLAIQVNTIQERFAGYEKALKEVGVSPDPLMVKYSFKESDYEEFGYRYFLELMNMVNPPTAIFSCTDTITLGIYRACHQTGIRIPEDISIVSYDNHPYTASLAPPLTTVAQPKYEMGKKAGDLLMRRIDGERGKPVEIVMENHLVERSSCAPLENKKGRTKNKLILAEGVMKSGDLRL